MYPSILLQRSKSLSDLFRNRLFIRLMGGGPRTFPGGLNKWQWKRMHEKRAREKEKRLLEQEKQLYQARIRSQIRAKLAGQAGPDSSPEPDTSGHGPMSSKDHIKALADRFMKAGAEDLWNEDDGPLQSPLSKLNEQTGSIGVNRNVGAFHSPVDLRKLVSEGSCMSQNRENVKSNYIKSRDYSVQKRLDSLTRRKFGRNESSSSDGDSVENFAVNLVKKSGNLSNSKNVGDNSRHRSISAQKKCRFKRNESSSSDGEDDDEDFGFESDDVGVKVRKSASEIGSRAALGKYDVKITKRVPLKELEEESDFTEEVELIKQELEKRKLVKNDLEKHELGEGEMFLSQKRFDECDISPLTVKALTAAGYIQMTRVQEATFSACLEGKDALVKAKTGTGKSVAFLLPVIETVLKATSSNTNQRGRSVYALIICPTRELASQLAAEANSLLKFHTGISVLTLVGGTRFKDDKKRLESDPCQIIVATPGRLMDHIENKGGLSVHLMGLKILVLHEADQLLDLGFTEDVEKILDCLPRQRQSLLFSATIPKEVRRVSQLVLKRDHDFIDTLGLGCVETHTKVKQSFLVVPHELHFQVVHHLLKDHIHRTPDYKVIVFCTTGMVTSLLYLLLREMKMNVWEMPSRKPQLYRTPISDEFRDSKRLILVTSDVSSRGMNYPDVTLVIQVGIPYDREQYIHRLGRTGCEGKGGEGILLLAPWEEYFLEELKDLPLERFPLPHINPEMKTKLEDSMLKVDNRIKQAAYYAWLGYYNSIREIGRDKTTLVELANKFCESIGLKKPPPLNRKTALKMGLKDIPGIRARN